MTASYMNNAFVVAPVQPCERAQNMHLSYQRSSQQSSPTPQTSCTSKKSAAGVAAAFGLVVATRPKRRGKGAAFNRVSMAAVKEKPIVLTGDTLNCALKMRCEIAQADYAIYWTRVGDEFVRAAEYVTPAQSKVLSDKGLASFTEVHVGKLDAKGDNPVAAVAESLCECFIPDASSCTVIGQGGIEKYDIASICFHPVEGGVLEYGITKDGPTTWETQPISPILPKRKMRECFENAGASYAVFWMEKNGWYSARSEYVTAKHKGGATFISEIKDAKFAADGDDPVAVAARSGRTYYVSGMKEEPDKDRRALLQKFGIRSVTFVPVTGGVLELGTPENAGLDGNALKATLKMCCDATAASYSLYWIKDGNEYKVKESYVTQVRREKLQAEGKTGSFAEASSKMVLKDDEESAVRMVADSGCSCVIPDIESHSMYFCRTAEAKHYGINSIVLLPVEGGVLEYGKNKNDISIEGEQRKHLTELLAEKKIAFQGEDYDRLKELKPEIDELMLTLGPGDWSKLPASPPSCPEFPKAEMRKALDDMNASYLLFWQRLGDSYVLTAHYMDPVKQRELKESRGNDDTYATKTLAYRLPADGDGCVPTAVRAGQEIVIHNPQTSTAFKRHALAKEFNVKEVHLVPCADGVFEYCILNA